MSPTVKNGLLLVVLLAILGLAGWVFSRGRKETTYPNDPATVTAWMCTKCGKHIELTAAKYHDWADSKDKVQYQNRIAVFLCPDCKEFMVRRAFINPQTGEWSVPGSEKPGAALKPGAPAPKGPK